MLVTCTVFELVSDVTAIGTTSKLVPSLRLSTYLPATSKERMALFAGMFSAAAFATSTSLDFQYECGFCYAFKAAVVEDIDKLAATCF